MSQFDFGAETEILTEKDGEAYADRISVSWLRVSGTTEMPQVDERVCHQLHAIVMLLDKLEPQQQPF